MTSDARMSIPPAGRLHGSFAGCQIGRPLGGGGMAMVYEARDLATGATLALKLVLLQPGNEGRVVLEAEREGAILQGHLGEADPRVARIFRYGEEGDYFFVQMELVEGKDLSHVLEGSPLPAAQAVRIGIEIGEVLRSAHSLSGSLDGGEFRGIVHGDIKPRNIRITPDGRVKVLDFGIAKALSLSRRLTRNEFGSLHYASPERLESGTVDERSDLWSLGVVLYEMLSGRLPFRGDNEETLERRIRDRRPPPPLVECAAPLRLIVEKALDPRLERRYADAVSMLADLVAFREGRPTLAEVEAAGNEPREQTRPASPLGPPLTAAPPQHVVEKEPDAGRAVVEPDHAAEAGDRTSTAEGLPDEAARHTTAEPAVEDTARRSVAPDAKAPDDATRRSASPGAIGPDDATRRTAGGVDEATRRTAVERAAGVDDATRRTVAGGVAGVDDATRRTVGDPTSVPAGSSASNAVHPGSVPIPDTGVRGVFRMIRGRWLQAVGLVIVIAFVWAVLAVAAQWRILGRSRALAGDLAAARIASDDALQEHKELARRAWTPLLLEPSRRELLSSYRSIADAVIEEYRASDSPLVRERDWQRAGAAVGNALTLDPRDKHLRASQSLIEGHLLRIALRGRRPDQGQVQEAIRKFRRSIELGEWGDPYLGLAALHAYVEHDVDETDAAVEKCAEQGLRPGRRERAEKADARLLRATDLWAARGSLARLPEESKYLEKIRDHLSEAIDLYGTVLGFENSVENLRKARRLRERVEERLAALESQRRGRLPWPFRLLQGDEPAAEGE